MMELWNTVSHNEKGKVVLYRFASAAPVVKAKEYWLTQFMGNYKREATLSEERLSEGGAKFWTLNWEYVPIRCVYLLLCSH